MSIVCPTCCSDHVIARDIGKKTGAMIGTVGGAASGAVGGIGRRFTQADAVDAACREKLQEKLFSR